jgi:hypothetical protein
VRRLAHGARPAQGVDLARMRFVFALYLAVIAAGLAFYIVVGLTHH